MKGISILIPVFNYSLQPLVQQLLVQIHQVNVPLEIICLDDASTNKQIQAANRSFCSKFSIINYQEMVQNRGRASLRNLLADAAQYDFLLFIDVDSLPNPHFLKNYIAQLDEHSVLAGGTSYSDNYKPNEVLRYRYGKAREEVAPVIRQQHAYRSITLNNILVPKAIFQTIRLDDAIATYGHEDTKFGYHLQEKNIPVLHILNPVEHTGLESNEVFLQKTQEAVRNLVNITQQGLGQDSKLYKTARFLAKWHLHFVAKSVLGVFRNYFRKNLLSSQPSLLYFDLYKLYFFLVYSEKRQ